MGYKEVHFCTTPFVNIRSSSTYIISIKVLNFPLKVISHSPIICVIPIQIVGVFMYKVEMLALLFLWSFQYYSGCYPPPPMFKDPSYSWMSVTLFQKTIKYYDLVSNCINFFPLSIARCGFFHNRLKNNEVNI
jgi:hypothetical protein